MDTVMPIMDGFAATKEIRKIEKYGRHVPIIAVTGLALGDNAIENAEEKCLRSGMDEYIPKPVIMQHLKSTILKWLQKSGAKKFLGIISSLRQLCIRYIAEHLNLFESFDCLVDEVVQSIANLAKHKSVTPKTLKLFSTAYLTTFSFKNPFPAFKIDYFLSLMQHQTRLTELDISGCTYLTDYGLAFVCKFVLLENLNISKCTRITDWGISSLRTLTKLTTINLEGCDLITDASIKLLKSSGLKNLTSISWDQI